MKQVVRSIVHHAGQVVVAPLLLLYWLQTKLLDPSRALEYASQFLAGIPGFTGLILRASFYSLVLQRCHRTAQVGYGTLLSQPGASLGSHVYIGPRCNLGLVTLEDEVLLAAGVQIPSGGQTHHFAEADVPIREQGGQRQRITIGHGAWIGSGAIVLADVGRGTIVGAGSVVTKPLPDNVIAAGVPAKVIRPRFAESASTAKQSETP